jgi:hypothetical protein
VLITIFIFDIWFVTTWRFMASFMLLKSYFIFRYFFLFMRVYWIKFLWWSITFSLKSLRAFFLNNRILVVSISHFMKHTFATWTIWDLFRISVNLTRSLYMCYMLLFDFGTTYWILLLYLRWRKHRFSSIKLHLHFGLDIMKNLMFQVWIMIVFKFSKLL